MCSKHTLRNCLIWLALMPDFAVAFGLEDAMLRACPGHPDHRELRFSAFSLCTDVELSNSYFRSPDSEDYVVGHNRQIVISLIRAPLGTKAIELSTEDMHAPQRRIIAIPHPTRMDLIALLSFSEKYWSDGRGLELTSFRFAGSSQELNFLVECTDGTTPPDVVTVVDRDLTWQAKVGDTVTIDYGTIRRIDCGEVEMLEGVKKKDGTWLAFKTLVPTGQQVSLNRSPALLRRDNP